MTPFAFVVVATVVAQQGPKLVVEVHGIPAPHPQTVDAAAASDAQALYAGRCALCHGITGAGDGPGAATFPKKPRRFSDATWQASVTDDAIANVVLNGATGPAKRLMPANPDLKDKPALVAALVGVVRGLGPPHGGVHVKLTRGKWHSSVDADADATGIARVDVGPVARGTYKIVVERAPGVVLCTTTAVVADADVTVTCAPAL